MLVGAGFEEALAEALAARARPAPTFVHAFEDERVIAGQGTIGLELAEQVPDARDGADPGRRRRPRRRGSRSRCARCARRSGSSACEARRDGYTIADGIAVKRPGELTSAILDELLDDLVEVTDEEISEAITLLLERSKLVVEGAGAVGVAALLAGKVAGSGAGRAPLLSGGNIDPTLLISVMQHGLTAGRPLPRHPHPPPRPPGRADQAARS